MTAFLKSHPMLRQAALVARTFRIDPLEVLNGTIFEWQIRTAALVYVQEMEQAEADRAKSRSKRKH